ncbi:hypothetical protein NMG60_11028680 [Bertholletia excelsa]
MSPPVGAEGVNQGNVSVMATELRERNYLGLSDCSSVDSSAVSSVSEDDKSSLNLNLKATELRLGLPGSQSPERDPEISQLNSGKFEEKPLFPLLPLKEGICVLSQKTVVSGNKRSFPEVPPKGNKQSEIRDSNNNSNPPAAKAQVVGWPPIRSFRKNTLATTSKNNDEVDGKPGPGTLFVKVSMDGAPYLRKVDLRMYSTYQELSSALEKMFSCFTIGQCSSHGAPGNGSLSEIKLRDLLHGSEYVLTYEDKDGDWMLVGDVPWEMFTETCKRLKIMKSSDAIGLAPRAMEKSKNRD